MPVEESMEVELRLRVMNPAAIAGEASPTPGSASSVGAPAWPPRSSASTAQHIGDRFKIKMADADIPRTVHQS